MSPDMLCWTMRLEEGGDHHIVVTNRNFRFSGRFVLANHSAAVSGRGIPRPVRRTRTTCARRTRRRHNHYGDMVGSKRVESMLTCDVNHRPPGADNSRNGQLRWICPVLLRTIAARPVSQTRSIQHSPWDLRQHGGAHYSPGNAQREDWPNSVISVIRFTNLGTEIATTRTYYEENLFEFTRCRSNHGSVARSIRCQRRFGGFGCFAAGQCQFGCAV